MMTDKDYKYVVNDITSTDYGWIHPETSLGTLRDGSDGGSTCSMWNSESSSQSAIRVRNDGNTSTTACNNANRIHCVRGN